MPNNNTAPFGINCSTEYLEADGNATYSVGAGISEVTIEVFGDGGNPAPVTIPVTPGSTLYAVFDGTNVFVTPLGPTADLADRFAQAIISTTETGGDGRVVITYDCTTPPPCTGTGEVFQYTDSEGFTIIRITGDCDSWTWNAPDGLDEFEVLVVGGGGGGGFGDAAGGGGGGAVIYQQYTGITMDGLPGLQGATFEVSPGGQGLGATSSGQQGGDGTGSSFTGSTFDYSGGNTFADLNAAGGGGGGSSSDQLSIRTGRDGASGGGGAAHGSDSSTGGLATYTGGNDGGTAYGQSYGRSGAGGGGAAAGGGSGNGDASLLNAGSGGNGVMYEISDEEVYYGAGGGGTSTGATVNEPGMGGSPYGAFYAGGRGNNTGRGLPATTYGSGGGAGRTGGSDGFQGVVYIRYPNFRILPVEYLYFNVEYNNSLRSGDLSWATAKEWENDRFEIERSVNNVTDWEKIGEVTGAGYSDGPVEYFYQDSKLPLAGGDIFYRLKQFDFDGDSTYSDIRAIQVDPMPGVTYWRVFPNPTSGDPINLEMIDTGVYNDEEISIRVIAATGVFDSISGKSAKLLSQQLSLILRDKAAGVYTLEISWGENREYHKVILRR